jgi:hypothetical protein
MTMPMLTTAENDRPEEAIFPAADPVTNHSDKPQEGDSGKRDKGEPDRHRGPPGRVGQPGSWRPGIGRR